MSFEYNEKVLNSLDYHDSPSPLDNLDGQLTDEQIHAIWASEMQEFSPDEMVNLLIPRSHAEALFEEIYLPEGTTIHGAFFVVKGSKDKTVSCLIFDPEKNVVYSRKNMQQGIILFQTTKQGEYSFVFDNAVAGQGLQITFALHTGGTVKEGISYDMDIEGNRKVMHDPDNFDPYTPLHDSHINEDHLAADQNTINDVYETLLSIHSEMTRTSQSAKTSARRQDGHNED